MIIVVQTYIISPSFVTPDDEMIKRIMHLPKEQHRLFMEEQAKTTQAHNSTQQRQQNSL